MGIIVGNAGIIASDYSSHTSDSAIDNIVVEWPVGGAEPAAEVIEDVLGGEAGDQVHLLVGDVALGGAPLGEVLHRGPDDPLGDGEGVLLIQLHVLHPGELGPGVGGDDLGVEVAGYLAHGGH